MSQYVSQFFGDNYGVIDKRTGTTWTRTGAFAAVGSAPNNPNTDRWAWDTAESFPVVGFRIVSASPEPTSWDAFQPRSDFNTSTTITPDSVGTGDQLFTLHVNNQPDSCGWILLKNGADTPIWYGNPDWGGFLGFPVFPLGSDHKMHFVPGGTLPAAVYGLK